MSMSNIKNPIQSTYYLYGQQLKQVTEAKYLDVTLDSKLNFNKHIQKGNSYYVIFYTVKSTYSTNLYQVTGLQNVHQRIFINSLGPSYQMQYWQSNCMQAARYVMDDYRYVVYHQ